MLEDLSLVDPGAFSGYLSALTCRKAFAICCIKAMTRGGAFVFMTNFPTQILAAKACRTVRSDRIHGILCMQHYLP